MSGFRYLARSSSAREETHDRLVSANHHLRETERLNRQTAWLCAIAVVISVFNIAMMIWALLKK